MFRKCLRLASSLQGCVVPWLVLFCCDLVECVGTLGVGCLPVTCICGGTSGM
jgi:hypothetical protein